jgi:hypothetical protein
MTKVRALQDGFVHGRRIRKGKVFDLPKGLKPGKWMQEVDDKGNPVSKNEAKKDADTKGGDLAALKYPELVEKAKALGLSFSTQPKKDDLIAAIKEAEGLKGPAPKGDGDLV